MCYGLARRSCHWLATLWPGEPVAQIDLKLKWPLRPPARRGSGRCSLGRCRRSVETWKNGPPLLATRKICWAGWSGYAGLLGELSLLTLTEEIQKRLRLCSQLLQLRRVHYPSAAAAGAAPLVQLQAYA